MTAQKLLYAVVFTVGEEPSLLRLFLDPPVGKAWCSGLLVIVEKLISFSGLPGIAGSGVAMFVVLLAKQQNATQMATPKIRNVFFTAQK